MASTAGFYSKLKGTLQATAPGRAAIIGIGETFGKVYGANKEAWIAGRATQLESYGFLGLKNSKALYRSELKDWIGKGGQQFMANGKVIRGESQAFARAGRSAARRGVFMTRAGAAFGVAAMAYGAYSGYQENGLMGAAGSVAQDALMWSAAKSLLTGFGAGTVIGGGLAIGAVAGGYALGEASQAYSKRMRGVEMGAPVMDPYGSISTTRQRSLAALQNTHINGRMGLGNEGLLMHDNAYSFRR